MASSVFILSIFSIFSFLFPPKDTTSNQKLKLVWREEFNKKGMPDLNNWNYEVGYMRNRELQYYTRARPENIHIKKGKLVIQALNDSMDIGNGKKAPITSASITTEGKKEFQYGRIEVRAKIPSSLGTWPAIWMIGKNRKYVGWPACGEIDLMEHVGFDPNMLHFNIHTKAYNHKIKTNKGAQVPYSRPYDGYHVYAIDWTKHKIDFFLDNKLVFTFKNEGTGSDAWPYDQPFFLILNLAFGGGWGGQKGVDVSSLPQKFYIDYVRVYQNNNSPGFSNTM